MSNSGALIVLTKFLLATRYSGDFSGDLLYIDNVLGEYTIGNISVLFAAATDVRVT